MASRVPWRRTLSLLQQRSAQYLAAPAAPAPAPPGSLYGSSLLHRLTGRAMYSSKGAGSDVIGIDLGTTNSCVAVMEGKVSIFGAVIEIVAERVFLLFFLLKEEGNFVVMWFWIRLQGFETCSGKWVFFFGMVFILDVLILWWCCRCHA
jgi:hypothetical protein